MLRVPFVKIRCLIVIAALLSSVPEGRALTLQLDYSDDQANGNFFGTHSLAKAALEKAASDINAAIQTTFQAVNTLGFSGNSGSSTASIDWSLSVTNPSTGANQTLPANFTLAANTVRIFVGMQQLSGNTLGVGGPGGAGVSLSAGGSAAATAMDNAEASSNAVMGRGAGPIMGHLSGTFAGGYNVKYGALVGNLWFDKDTNNDGVDDSDAVLNQNWHFDISTQPTSSQSDFYSVALHELLHSIGFGTSESWTSDSSGTNWLGANADALDPAHGTNLITTDGHIRSGFVSTTLFGGVSQKTVMDPVLVTGERRFLTQMDAALLRDIGYTVVPEPGVWALLGLGAFAAAWRGRRRG